MKITKYAVCDNPDEWGDEPLTESYQDAKAEAQRDNKCVVALEYEYSDSELVDDFREEEEEEEEEEE